MKYNYTIVLDHKPKIVIPYTNLVIRGKLFLVLSFMIVLLLHLPIIILTIIYDLELVKFIIATFMISYFVILMLVQNYNSETGNYVFMEKIKLYLFKKLGSKVIIVDNRHKLLARNKKVYSKDILSYLLYK